MAHGRIPHPRPVYGDEENQDTPQAHPQVPEASILEAPRKEGVTHAE